jgi:hypothetical protein
MQPLLAQGRLGLSQHGALTEGCRHFVLVTGRSRGQLTGPPSARLAGRRYTAHTLSALCRFCCA